MKRLALLAFLLLAGCGTHPVLPPDQAFIAPDVSITVPGPATLGRSAVIAQTVTASFRGQSFVFQAYVNIAPDVLELAALDGLGRRLFTVHWQSGAFDYAPSPAMPKDLRPANMLADLALIYWPADALQPLLAKAGATLQETSAGRTILKDGKPVIRIERPDGPGWTGTAHYRNLAFDYSLDIQSAEVPP
jgi:hypothetical protein